MEFTQDSDMGRGEYLGKNLLEEVVKEESEYEKNKLLITPNTRIKCSICGYFMSQSQNDSELFLCYRCNIKIYQSDLDVEQMVVPKRESPGLKKYGDEYVNQELSPDKSSFFRDGEIDVKSFSLLNMNDGTFNSYNNFWDVERERTRQKIHESFAPKHSDNMKVHLDQKQ